MTAKLKSWSEQIASDQGFLRVAIPFALCFVIGALDTRLWLTDSWPIAMAAGAALGCLASLIVVRWNAGGLVTFVALLRLAMIVLREIK